MINEGDLAPEFTLPTDGGGFFKLSEQMGKKVVLFFYPKDNTPGCTKEAVGFSGLVTEFGKLNTVVAGISPDSVSKHDKFREKHSLSTPLISDEEKTVLMAYGVWKEKSMYGKTYIGVERTTLLINEKGIIIRVWRKVKVPGHVEEVLKTVMGL